MVVSATDGSWVGLLKLNNSFSCQNAACNTPNLMWDDGTPFNNLGLFTIDGSSSANYYDIVGHLTKVGWYASSVQIAFSNGQGTYYTTCEMPCGPSKLSSISL